jgi:hypothetical protein
LVHALVAMDMPGPGTVFLSQNWRFTAPVYIGDTITAEAEVVSVHPSKPVAQLRVQIRRTDGTTVLEGEAWCFTFADWVTGGLYRVQTARERVVSPPLGWLLSKLARYWMDSSLISPSAGKKGNCYQRNVRDRWAAESAVVVAHDGESL